MWDTANMVYIIDQCLYKIAIPIIQSCTMLEIYDKKLNWVEHESKPWSQKMGPENFLLSWYYPHYIFPTPATYF